MEATFSKVYDYRDAHPFSIEAGLKIAYRDRDFYAADFKSDELRAEYLKQVNATIEESCKSAKDGYDIFRGPAIAEIWKTISAPEKKARELRQRELEEKIALETLGKPFSALTPATEEFRQVVFAASAQAAKEMCSPNSPFWIKFEGIRKEAAQ